MSKLSKNRRPSWDETFMRMLSIYEERSTCVYYNIAAILGDNKTGRLISVGYNGSVRGDVHCVDVGCNKEVGGKRLPPGSNRCRGVHAEINAILNLVKLGVKINETDIKNATLYVSVRPCLDCAKAMINAGIKRILYHNDYDGDRMTFSLCRQRGVKLVKFKE